MAHYDDINDKISEKDFVIRTPEVYEHHLNALHENEDNGPTYGVLRECPLSKLPYFQTVLSFPPDIMHDLLEGIVPLLLHKLVRFVLRDKIVTLVQFNKELIKATSCLIDKPNKLTTNNVSANGSIVGSASQKWQLFLAMPHIVGQHIPDEYQPWQVYLLLRQITDIVFASPISTAALLDLEISIEMFLKLYKEVFDDANITPKFHYLLHYPRLIKIYGPLRLLWCLRFESKHQYFKKVVRSAGNYINVTYTMARRHQMRQCWEFSTDVLYNSAQCLTKTSPMPFSELPFDLTVVLTNKLQIDINGNEMLTFTNNLLFNNVTYKIDNYFIVDMVEDNIFSIYREYIISEIS